MVASSSVVPAPTVPTARAAAAALRTRKPAVSTTASSDVPRLTSSRAPPPATATFSSYALLSANAGPSRSMQNALRSRVSSAWMNGCEPVPS